MLFAAVRWSLVALRVIRGIVTIGLLSDEQRKLTNRQPASNNEFTPNCSKFQLFPSAPAHSEFSTRVPASETRTTQN